MSKNSHAKRRSESQPRKKRAISKRKNKNDAQRGLVHKLQKHGHQDKSQTLQVTHSSPDERVDNDAHYMKITPDMIVDSLRMLSLWQEPVQFNNILKHVKDRYPVNPDLKLLEIELRLKLRVAEKAGIVISDKSDRWRLRSGLERLRQVPETLLSLFWQIHCDTINPLADKRKRNQAIKIVFHKKDAADSDPLTSDVEEADSDMLPSP